MEKWWDMLDFMVFFDLVYEEENDVFDSFFG